MKRNKTVLFIMLFIIAFVGAVMLMNFGNDTIEDRTQASIDMLYEIDMAYDLEVEIWEEIYKEIENAFIDNDFDKAKATGRVLYDLYYSTPDMFNIKMVKYGYRTRDE